MKIIKIESHPYELKFKKSFKTSKSNYEYRNGFIIKFFIDDLMGLGEVSPLDNFHKESLIECYYALEAINQMVNDIGEITANDLFDIFSLHSSDKPSLLFGLETALYDIVSQRANLPLNKYLNLNSSKIVHLNGVHSIHSQEDNFKVVKIKLGYNNIYDDIDTMENISSLYDSSIKFRIDVNGKLDLVKAIRFCKSMEKFNIEYIEQPLPKDELDDLSELRMHTKIPIAVDESLTSFSSAEKIIDIQAADFFVIKPMMIGSYKEINEIIDLATKNNIKCIITNMLDRSINRMACLHLASANNIKSACGLSIDNLLDLDSYQTPKILNGELVLPGINGLGLVHD